MFQHETQPPAAAGRAPVSLPCSRVLFLRSCFLNATLVNKFSNTRVFLLVNERDYRGIKCPGHSMRSETLSTQPVRNGQLEPHKPPQHSLVWCLNPTALTAVGVSFNVLIVGMVSNNSPFVKPAHQELAKGELCLVSLLALPGTAISAGSRAPAAVTSRRHPVAWPGARARCHSRFTVVVELPAAARRLDFVQVDICSLCCLS